MRGTQKSAVAVVAAVVAVALGGCGGGDGWPDRDRSGAVTLTATRAPSWLSSLGLRHAFRLPSGWTVDGAAVSAGGTDAVFTAAPARPRQETQGGGPNPWPDYIWSVDTRTGRGWRSRQVDNGWFIGDYAAASGWAVHDETRGASGPWRLYAQRDHGAPVLLESSRDDDGPQLSSDGASVAWDRTDDAGKLVIEQWRPGESRPEVIVRFAGAENIVDLQVLAGAVEWVESGTSGTTVHTERDGRQSQTDAFPAQTHTASVNAQGDVAYFQNECWRVHRRGDTAAAPCLGPSGLAGAYGVAWSRLDSFVGRTPTGDQLISTTPGTKAVDLDSADSTAQLSAPRADGGRLSMAETTGSASYIAW